LVSEHLVITSEVKMAWEARLGLKLIRGLADAAMAVGQNGLGSPSGIETEQKSTYDFNLWARQNGLGSPSGIETPGWTFTNQECQPGQNGLGSPSGIETSSSKVLSRDPW